MALVIIIFVLKKHDKLRSPHTWIAKKHKETYENFFKSKATEDIKKYNNFNQINKDDIYNIIEMYSKMKTKDTKDIIYGGEQNVNELRMEKFDINKCDRKCFFHATQNNRSIGVFIIFDNNDKKYAIICNHTNKDDINEVKKDLRKNYTIINLPRVQSDSHSCSVLNKIFLQEMHKFFVKDEHSIDELLKNCRQDKIENNNDIVLNDDTKQLFPDLYKYQQYSVANNNQIPKEFKSNLLVTDKYNIIQQKKEPHEDKIFNLGLLREGWDMAIDFIKDNIDERGDKWVDIDENVRNIIQRAQPFEGNQAIIMGLQKEYQEKYKYLQSYHICECNNLCCCVSNKTSTEIDEHNINL